MELLNDNNNKLEREYNINKNAFVSKLVPSKLRMWNHHVNEYLAALSIIA